MAEVHLYPDGLVPDNPNESDGTPTRVLGTVAFSDIDTYVVALEWLAPTNLPAFCSLSLWTLTGDDPLATTGTRLDLLEFPLDEDDQLIMTGGGWNRLDLPVPRFFTAGRPIYGQVHTDGHYVYSAPNDFPITSDDATLHSFGSEAAGNGRWRNSGDQSTIADTNPGSRGYNFFVSIVTNASPLTEINATLDLVLPAVDHSGVAAADVGAVLDITLPAITGSLEGAAAVAAVLDVTLPPHEIAAAGSAPAAATLDLTLPPPTHGLEGSAPATAVLDLVLPAVDHSGVAAADVGAVLDITLPAVAVQLDPGGSANAVLDITLPAVDHSVVGTAHIGGALEITLPPVSHSAEGAAIAAAVLDLVLPVPQADMAASIPVPEPVVLAYPSTIGMTSTPATVRRSL